MCGLAGVFARAGARPPEREELARMSAALAHRGPDGFGVFVRGPIGLGHARLSIIDLEGGFQPMTSESGTRWVSYNGEVYNYLELREELEDAGHLFRTRSDTEVLLHAWEEWGEDFVTRLNGNFAFALWDEEERRLLLGRDRLGIRPLYWCEREGRLLFASELGALIEAGVPVEPDARALDQCFVLWTSVAPRALLRGVSELPPGCLLEVRGEAAPRLVRYWDLPHPEEAPEQLRDEREAAEALRALLEDSVRLRLRADVPVGAYLSGGLDSTAASALARAIVGAPIETYSISFSDARFDERPEQELAAEALGTRHHRIEVGDEELAEAFPDAVLHAEKPLMRTAPVPLYLLAGLVRSHGTKVVLTGEGADEILGGYDIFKETKIRAWWARRPESRMRPALLRKLYPFAPGAGARAIAFFEAFYREGIDAPADPGFSHRPTWRNGARNRAFYGERLREELAGEDAAEDLLAQFHGALAGRDALARAEYIETRVFLAGHLLQSQGDRMSLAHGVEGRYPFLDHRIVEFGQRIAATTKLPGLDEKRVLRRAVADLVPGAIAERRKRPFIAPNVSAFVRGRGLELARALLDPTRVRALGLFDAERASRLLEKAGAGRGLGEREAMALVGMLSAQSLFCQWQARKPRAVDLRDFPSPAESVAHPPGKP